MGIVVLAVSARSPTRLLSTSTRSSRFDRDRQISRCMTAVYGSGVTTNGARDGRGVVHPRRDDEHVCTTSLQLLNRGDFEVLFESMPIISARGSKVACSDRYTWRGFRLLGLQRQHRGASLHSRHGRGIVR